MASRMATLSAIMTRKNFPISLPPADLSTQSGRNGSPATMDQVLRFAIATTHAKARHCGGPSEVRLHRDQIATP